MLSTTVLAGGGCLMVDDLTGEDLREISGAIGYRYWNEGLQPNATERIIDHCLNPQASNMGVAGGQDDLLKIVKVEEDLINYWGDTACNDYVSLQNFDKTCAMSNYSVNCTKTC